MGIVAKESIKNTIYSFIGIGLGALYTLFIVPKVFDQNPGQWGLIQLLISYVMLFMPFALFGFSNIIIKFWPRIQESERGSFVNFLFIIVLIGLIIMSIVVYLFRTPIFSSDSKDNALFQQYYLYFFPIFFIHTFFYFFLYYARVYYKTSYPTFLKDTFIKIWTFLLIVVLWYFKISFRSFFNLYFFALIIQLALLLFYIKKEVPFAYSIDFSFFKKKKLVKEIFNFGFFSLLAGVSSTVISRIDLFMINKYINLEEVAYYSIALFFITVMQTPSRSIQSIVVPFLSESIEKKDNQQIAQLYHKSTSNLFLTVSYILMIILLNLDGFMNILGSKFGQIEIVIIILGISKLYELINSINYSIIIITKYYRYEMLFQALLLVLTVVSNILLIPYFGIEGVALASAITSFLSTSLRALFVYSKYKLVPFDLNSLKILAIIGLSLISTLFIPNVINVYITMLLKSVIISIVYVIFSLLFKVSYDMKEVYDNVITKLLKYIKKIGHLN